MLLFTANKKQIKKKKNGHSTSSETEQVQFCDEGWPSCYKFSSPTKTIGI